ncbi:MAG: hypothetical protein QXG86_00475 [Candidatus Woesearchaeota archaeon]
MMSMLGIYKNKFLVDMDRKIKNSFNAVKEELEDHLVAINENTAEIKNHENFLEELADKIEKLNERIDELQMMIVNINQNSLSENEQRVFDLLKNFSSPLSCSDIAMRLNLTELTVKAHLFSMICKGIPVKEKIIDNQSFFLIEKKFKEKLFVEKTVKF